MLSIAVLVAACNLSPVVTPLAQPVAAEANPCNPANTPKGFTQVGVIYIARIKMKCVIYRGVIDKVFRRGVGYWPGTGLPGQVGNMVLGGHRVTWPNPFRNIDRIEVGDPIIIKYKDKYFTYVVTKKQVVRPTDTWILSQKVSKPTLTMFACHPVGSYRQRYTVTAVLKT